MRPRWRVGGEAKRGGHGEELGKGGREEGGAGGGPGAACGPQPNPHLGQVLPGLGSSSPSSKNSRGCHLPAGAIGPSVTHPSTPTVPSATSPGAVCPRAMLPVPPRGAPRPSARCLPEPGDPTVATVGPGPVPVPSPWGTRGARWLAQQPSCSSPTSPGSSSRDVLGSRACTQSILPPPRCLRLLPARGRSSLPGTGRVKGWLERAAAHLLMGSCQKKQRGGGRPLPRAPRGPGPALGPRRTAGKSLLLSQPEPLVQESPTEAAWGAAPQPGPRFGAQTPAPKQRLQPQHRAEGTQRGAEAPAGKAHNPQPRGCFGAGP